MGRARGKVPRPMCDRDRVKEVEIRTRTPVVGRGNGGSGLGEVRSPRRERGDKIEEGDNSFFLSRHSQERVIFLGKKMSLSQRREATSSSCGHQNAASGSVEYYLAQLFCKIEF